MEESKQEYLSRLEEQMDDYEEHHKRSFPRIERWYLYDWEDKQEYADILNEEGFRTDTWKLEDLKAPHDILAERAAIFVTAGIKIERNGESKMSDVLTSGEVGEILVGTGIEGLVKSIVLRERPEYFIEKSNIGEFASFSDCKCCLLGIISESLSKEQKKYCRLGLEIAWDYRNNTIHAGYHRQRVSGHTYVVYHVTEFLFKEFFENRTEVIDSLSARREELNLTQGQEYPILELP